MDNYLMLDGKKYELSPELANALLSCVEPEPQEKSPFERGEIRSLYYYITETGIVWSFTEDRDGGDDMRYAVANYCTDKSLMQQRAMHENLNRLLWRYSEEHGGDSREWDGRAHYYICFSKMNRLKYEVYPNDNFCIQGVIYFKDEETAEAAIEDIVKPFISAHPDFVW